MNNSMYGDDEMYFEDDWIKPLLLTGERVLWRGRPDSYSPFEKSEVIGIPFSLLWAGFAFYWEYSVITNDAPLMFKIYGIPFVLMGIYIVFGRFAVKKHQLRHTYYAITNMRVIRSILNKTDSRSLDALPNIEVAYGKNGMGTIRFDTSDLNIMDIGSSFLPGYAKRTFSFYRIADVQKVYSQLMKARDDFMHG